MRTKERILLGIASLLLILMGVAYLHNIAPQLEEVQQKYAKDEAVNLSAGVSAQKIKAILAQNDYFGDPAYEAYAALKLKKLCEQMTIPNLGVLNKRKLGKGASGVNIFVSAEELAQEGGKLGQQRYRESCITLGRAPEVLKQLQGLKPSSVQPVSDSVSNLSIWGRIMDEEKRPVIGCIVRLSEEWSQHKRDSMYKAALELYRGRMDEFMAINLDSLLQTPIHYAQSDEQGYYRFVNLREGHNYAVIPLGEGKEYGVLRGVAEISPATKEKLCEINFTEREHRLPLFDAMSFGQIKRDRIFTIRTPEVFRSNFVQNMAIFLVGFWLLHAFLSISRRKTDEWILPLICFLSGVGFLMLFALQDPLIDISYGAVSAWGVLALCCAMCVAFRLSRWLQIPLYWTPRHYWAKRTGLANKSWGVLLLQTHRGLGDGRFWLFVAIALMCMLWGFGTGPEGSGVKVNLFGVQISELSKFFVVLFMAYFFYSNQNKLRQISDNKVIILRYLVGAILFFGILVLIYVGAVGDQGPALVLCITLMLLYAYTRYELGLVLLTSLCFSSGLLFLSMLGFGAKIYLLYSAIVLGGLGLFVYQKRKYESTLLPVLLISAFVALSAFSADFSQRLADRNSMYANIWDNKLYGGDQVAQGVWALNYGGLFGRGLGEGFSRVMPAYNTDMIFESIGEELGILFLCFLLLLYIVLFWRTVLVARRTGNSLYSYIIMGISCATMVQLGVIVAGSLGLVPLTGITVPFLSRGDSSLLVNILAFFVILFLSQFHGTKEEVEHITKRNDTSNIYLLLGFSSVAVVFALKLGAVWWQANETMVRPVKTLSKQGEYLLSENPRLTMLKNKLPAGSIYDRNGILLATSDKQLYTQAEAKARLYGADMAEYERQKHRNRRRYYPFGTELIYWLGDAQTGLVSNTRLGYVAEYRLQDALRGIETSVLSDSIAHTDVYREADYLPRENRESRILRMDNSGYVPYLRAGLNSKKVTNYDTAKHDVTLTLDVQLQHLLSQIIRTPEYAPYRVSVVATLAATGDVLASAMNPKPDRVAIENMSSFDKKYYYMLYTHSFGYDAVVADCDYGIVRQTTPGSVIKTVDAMAFFNKVGIGAKDTSYYFTVAECIRAGEPVGNVNLERAIISSSNLYFITLMNKEDLHHQLFPLYHSVGMSIDKVEPYFVDKPQTKEASLLYQRWFDLVAPGKGVAFNNPRYQGTDKRYRYSQYSDIAWGQGLIEASPLQMARLYGAVANGGKLQSNRFVLADETGELPPQEQEKVMQYPETAKVLEGFLGKQENTAHIKPALGLIGGLYGKTGTPQRTAHSYNKNKRIVERYKVRDAWYICYTRHSKYASPLVLAIRIEGKGGSGLAVTLAREILSRLKAQSYI